MATNLRKAPGMREKQPEVWELIVEAGIDPVTGKRRQVSRVFRGTCATRRRPGPCCSTEVEKGRHTGTAATVDQLFADWLVELERKGRSPNTIHGYQRTYSRNIKATLGNVPVTKVTTKMLTDLYGAHQRRGLKPRSVYQIHATLSSMFTQACRWGWRDSEPGAVGRAAERREHGPGRPDARGGDGAHRRGQRLTPARQGPGDVHRGDDRPAPSRDLRASSGTATSTGTARSSP